MEKATLDANVTLRTALKIKFLLVLASRLRVS